MSYDNNKFNVREYALGSVFDRHHFHTLDFDESTLHSKPDQFRSLYNHSDQVQEYLKNNIDNSTGKSTLSGYREDVATDELVLDLDNNDLESTFSTLKDLLRAIESRYEVDLRYLRINLSGGKGFHIRIPSELFGSFEPSEGLPQIQKSIVEEMTEGFEDDIDYSIYRHTGFIRVINSINGKTGLHAIPLTADEIFNLSLDEIQELAKSPRQVEYIDNEELTEVDELVALKETKTISTTKKRKSKSAASDLWSGKSSGKRHENLLKLVGRLIKKGISQDDILNICLVWDKQNNPPKGEKEIIKQVNDLVKRYGDEEEGPFWNFEGGEINIISRKLIDFLEREGFAKRKLGRDCIFYRVSNKVAKEQVFTEIKDFIRQYLLNTNNGDEVWEEMLQNISKYFGEKFIEFVKSEDLELHRDTHYVASLFFKETILELKKGEEPKMFGYEHLDKPIWASQIIDKKYSLIEIKREQAVFEKFLLNVCGNDIDRFLSLCSAIGYLLHSHKDRSNPKAIILCDETISENPNGRTGKSLIGKALSHLKQSVRIDGKNHEFQERFTFQQTKLNTEVIEFNDVKKNFNFEKLFSVITEDMTVEYKNKTPFEIQFEESPKFLISTNYTIKGRGDSYKDRMYEIELSDHYSADHKPVDDFGHIFFDDWDEKEWNLFLNFMVECLQLYLDEGLLKRKEVNLLERKLLDNTHPDFLDFVEKKVDIGEEYDKDDLFKSFKSHLGYDEAYDWLNGNFPHKKNTFTKWLKIYSEYKNLKFLERKSSGRYYICLN